MRPAPEPEDLLPPHKRARVSAGDTAKLDFIVEAVTNKRSGFEQPAVLAPTVDAAVFGWPLLPQIRSHSSLSAPCDSFFLPVVATGARFPGAGYAANRKAGMPATRNWGS